MNAVQRAASRNCDDTHDASQDRLSSNKSAEEQEPLIALQREFYMMLGQSRRHLCVGIDEINRIHHLLRYDPDQPWAGTRKPKHPVQKGPSLGS